MDALTFLSGHVPLFEGISTEALTELAVNATLRQLSGGQIALRAGMTVDGLYVIATGKCEVHAKVPNKGTVMVAELGPGGVFGEGSILDRSVAGATIKAGADGSVVLLIPEGPFLDLVSADPAFGERVRALAASRRAAPPKA